MIKSPSIKSEPHVIQPSTSLRAKCQAEKQKDVGLYHIAGDIHLSRQFVWKMDDVTFQLNPAGSVRKACFNNELNHEERTTQCTVNIFYVLVHEIGHALGLQDDSFDERSVMYRTL